MNELATVILYELSDVKLGELMLHGGPPASNERAMDFVEKALSSQEVVAGPWIKGGRLYCLKRRRYTSAAELLREKLSGGEVSVARGLADALKKARLLENLDEIAGALTSLKMESFLKEFLEACPNYLKAYRLSS